MSKLVFITIVGLCSLGYFATDIYLPSLPYIAEYFSTTEDKVQLTLTLYLISSALSQLVYGPLSDRLGRKRTLLFGIVIGLVSSIFSRFAYSIDALILGRLIQGCGFGATMVLTRAILSDLATGKTLAKYGSYLGILVPIVLAIAPVIGGYLQNYFSWKASFDVICLVTILLMIAMIRLLPETNKQYDQTAMQARVLINNYSELLSNQKFIGYAACSGFGMGGIMAYLTLGPFLIQNVHGLSPVQFGWLAMIVCSFIIIGSSINTRLLQHFELDQLLKTGSRIMIFSGLLLLTSEYVVNHFAPLIVCTCIFISGITLTFSNSIASAMQGIKRLGLASALFGSIQVLGGSLFSGIISFLPDNNAIPLACIYISVGIGNGIILSKITKK